MTNKHLFAVILAGGGGTRLWPKSRTKFPKQFLKLSGKDSMLQITAARFNKIVSWEKMIVITNQNHLELVKKQLPQIPLQNIIAEPDKKDTAMAMLIATLYAKNIDDKAIIINGAADHVVADEVEFVRLMKVAALVAEKDEYIVAVGITPTYPSTAFGYIKIGPELKKIDHIPVFKVASFTEKPNQATARAFLSSGHYFWNANNYVWSAQAIQAAFKKYQPKMYEVSKKLEGLKADEFKKSLTAIYQQIESISIDYAISEKIDNLVLIPGDFGWEDIGEWKVVYDLGKKDLAGNVIIGEQENIHTLTIQSQNNLIQTNNRLVALLDINNMIVVDTDEILLICPKSRSQEVKKIVQRLKEEGKKEYL